MQSSAAAAVAENASQQRYGAPVADNEVNSQTGECRERNPIKRRTPRQKDSDGSVTGGNTNALREKKVGWRIAAQCGSSKLIDNCCVYGIMKELTEDVLSTITTLIKWCPVEKGSVGNNFNLYLSVECTMRGHDGEHETIYRSDRMWK